MADPCLQFQKVQEKLKRKQAYMAYKSRLNIIAEVYWWKLSYYSLLFILFYSLFYIV